jgi:hypothetical protein
MKLTKNYLDLYKSINQRGIGRICNDLERREVNMLTQDQWKEFCKAYHDWNGDPETFEERTSFYMMDFMVVNFIQDLLMEAYMEASQEIGDE